MKKISIMVLSLLLAFCPCASFPLCVQGQTNDVKAKDFFVDTEYTKYLDDSGFSDASTSVVSTGADYFSELNSKVECVDTYQNKSNVLLWQSKEGNVTYRFEVPESALYNIHIVYLPLENNGLDINYGLMIDGEYPFEMAKELSLSLMWVNDGETHKDSLGNQYAPNQIQSKEFIEKNVYDPDGIVTDDLKFAFSAGTHDVTIEACSQPIVIATISLSAPEIVRSYGDIEKEYRDNDYKNYNGETIIIQGEDAKYKSTRSLVSKSDSTSIDLTPNSPTVSFLNYIGASNWKSPGEELIWEVEAPKDALYQIGFNYKQSTVINGVSYRHLKVDGATPFIEAKSIPFNYDTSWQYETFGDGDKPYLIYLSKGKHTLSLNVTLADYAEYYKALSVLVSDIGVFYLEVVKITGTTPDKNRDYDLFNQIENYNQRLTDFYSDLNELSIAMESISGKRGSSFVGAVNNMARVAKSMIDNPYTAQNYLNDFYNQYITLGSWLYEMTSLPLSMDCIYLSKPDDNNVVTKANLPSKIGFGIKRFLISFTEDYNTLNNNENSDKTLKIWVNWGRDQVMVLNSLIQESFTPETGISVNLEMTNASLIKGMLADIQPDLSLHLARTEPVNLAMRGGLYDLSQFDDYESVITRFGKTASEPYKYKDGVYALPDTQSFYIMFYRKDILDSLRIDVPETWDEFIEATSLIQRNNLQVYLPYTQITAATTVNTGVGGLNLFATILQQFGGSFYNIERTECDLKTANAFKAITYWTDFYTKYRVPTTASFYNRFRSGTVPLGIEGYTQYTQLLEAAPEIRGKWGIALVPGTVDENGTVNHTVSGSGTGCSILKKSKNKEAAWEFLKWWTSEETQLAYNNNVEAILGSISRTTTATYGAFERMSWDSEDLKILMEQRSWISEVPEVPGSYYLSRAVDQAFWAVYNKDENPKDVLSEWSDLAQDEIKRKMKEYS